MSEKLSEKLGGKLSEKLVTSLAIRASALAVADFVAFVLFKTPKWTKKIMLGAGGLMLAYGVYSDIVEYDAANILFQQHRSDDIEGVEQLVKQINAINGNYMDKRLIAPDKNGDVRNITLAVNSMLDRITDKSRQRNNFLSDVNHELKTPIAVVQGYASMLDRWGKNDAEIRQECINAIRAEAENMDSLLSSLYFLSQGNNGNNSFDRKHINWSPLAEEILHETELIVSDKKITGYIAPDVYVESDPSVLKQVMRILINNADKYTQDGDGEIHISLVNLANEAVFSVTDNGRGVPSEDIDKIFQRFYRGQNTINTQISGHGLGLSIAKWIADEHNGSIEVYSKPNEGSRFSLVIPNGQNN